MTHLHRSVEGQCKLFPCAVISVFQCFSTSHLRRNESSCLPCFAHPIEISDQRVEFDVGCSLVDTVLPVFWTLFLRFGTHSWTHAGLFCFYCRKLSSRIFLSMSIRRGLHWFSISPSGMSLFFLRRMFESTNPINRSEDSPSCRRSFSFRLGVKLSAVWDPTHSTVNRLSIQMDWPIIPHLSLESKKWNETVLSLSLLERIFVVYSSHIGCCSLLLWLFLYRSFHSFSSYLYAETNSLFLACCYCFSVRLDWFLFHSIFSVLYLRRPEKPFCLSLYLSVYRFSVSFACLFNERKKKKNTAERMIWHVSRLIEKIRSE